MSVSPFFIRTSSYLAMFIVMLFFEWLAPFARSEQKKSYRVIFHFGISVMNSLILFFILAGPTYTTVKYTQEHPWGLSHLFGLSGGLEILATVIAFDIWDYWMHLANHKIGFLWRFHKVHHSDMEIDVTTASQFHHSNVDIPFSFQDRLEKLFVTPRMHRCHHALRPSCFNTNFSAILSLWERLFGTYRWGKDKKELEPIGVFKPRGPLTMKLFPVLLTPIKIIE